MSDDSSLSDVVALDDGELKIHFYLYNFKGYHDIHLNMQ